MSENIVEAALRMTHADWQTLGRSRFGEDFKAWRFVCPSCGHVAAVSDWIAAGAPAGHIAYSCVGRALGAERELGGKGPGPCNYAGGGLFKLNPVTVVFPDGSEDQCFAFAPHAEDPR